MGVFRPCLLFFLSLAGLLPAQVTYDRILHAEREPQNWLTYGGGYASQRYSLLTGLTRDNVKDLELKWVYHPKYMDKMEATPLVVDGILYTVQNSEVVAMDAATGRAFWTFRYAVPPESNAYLMVVKGLAISGDTLFWATYDGHLIAIDAKTGQGVWNKVIVDWHKGYQLNVAPLVVKNMLIMGPATNERGMNCWVAAYDIKTHDEFDWDSVQVPVLTGLDWKGTPRKVMLWANRNGFFYMLDRTSGEFLMAKAFVKQNWNVGFDENGRPVMAQGLSPKPANGPHVEPGTQGGTNWYSPSFSPSTGLFYIPTWENSGAPAGKSDPGKWVENQRYMGAGGPGGLGGGRRPASIAYRTDEEGYGAVRAIDPRTGEKKWDFKLVDYTESGVLTTASDLLFSGSREGNFFALDARNGTRLWSVNLGGTVASGPVTFGVNKHQYVAVCADSAMYVFGLPD